MNGIAELFIVTQYTTSRFVWYKDSSNAVAEQVKIPVRHPISATTEAVGTPFKILEAWVLHFCKVTNEFK